MLKVASKIMQNFSRKMSCDDTIKKVLTKNLINVDLKALKGLAAQKEMFVQKNFAKTFDISCVLDTLRQQASEIKPFKIIQDGKELALEAFEGTQKGSNKGFFCFNPQDSKLYYAKIAKDQSISEVFASKLYELTGANVPKMSLFKDSDGNIGLLSEYIPDLSPVLAPNKLATSDYAADVWLGNWDAVCSNNLQTNGVKQFRIDFGGALEYRAQGARKQFTCVPKELATLIDSEINSQSAHIFSKMTREDLIFSLKKVVNCSDEDIISLAKQFYQERDADRISRILIKRKEFLQYVLELIEKTPLENKTLIQYLGEIQEKILTTPLWEFDAYKGNLKKPKDISLLKLEAMFAARKSNKAKLISEMEKQRNNISFQDSHYTLDSFLASEIKDSSGMNVNSYIRWGEANSRCSEVSKMDKIMSQTSLPKMTLYRGGGHGDLCLGEAGYSSEIFDKIFHEGECFVIPIYPNTSLNKKVAIDFAGEECSKIVWQFNVPRGTKGIWMEGLSKGEEVIKARNEEEVLLQRDLPCMFKKRTPYFTYDLIEVDVLSNPKRHKFVDLKSKYFGKKV